MMERRSKVSAVIPPRNNSQGQAVKATRFSSVYGTPVPTQKEPMVIRSDQITLINQMKGQSGFTGGWTNKHNKPNSIAISKSQNRKHSNGQ